LLGCSLGARRKNPRKTKKETWKDRDRKKHTENGGREGARTNRKSKK
jgi:hypothetical protein